MYEFIDTIEKTEGILMPSEALNFNGEYLENLIPGYRTLYVSGREVIESELKNYEVGISDGAKHQRKRYPSRVITVGYQLIAEDNAAFRAAYNQLNFILNEEEAKLIFADEPDKYYIGTKQSGSSVESGVNSVTGELEFYCADPFKYAVNEKTVIPMLDDNITFVVNYKGTYKAYPSIEAEISGDIGFVGYVNQNGKVLQIGNVDEVDTEHYLSSETLIDDSFTEIDVNGWVTNCAETVKVVSEHKQIGTVAIAKDKNNNSVISGNAFGTGTNWHGPSITKVIPADSNGKAGAQNCTFSWKHIYTTSHVKNLGVIQFLLTGYDENENKKNIAAVTFFKNQAGNNTGYVHLYVGGIMRKELSFDCGADNSLTGYQTGRSSISKFGEKLSFNIQGRNFDFKSPELADMEAREVSIYFGKWGNYTPVGLNGVYSVKVVSHSVDSWRDVPNKFGLGDVIKANCRNGEVLVNDVLTPGIGALGNDWEDFCLVPGMNQIQCTYSSWAERPEFKLKYREVYL